MALTEQSNPLRDILIIVLTVVKTIEYIIKTTTEIPSQIIAVIILLKKKRQ